MRSNLGLSVYYNYSYKQEHGNTYGYEFYRALYVVILFHGFSIVDTCLQVDIDFICIIMG